MTLEELITELEKEDCNKVCRIGFNNPHSYRGYYDELAFEPTENVTIYDMLECANAALGNTYNGYKGGRYRMNGYTNVHLAYRGSSGQPLTKLSLAYMTGAHIDISEILV